MITQGILNITDNLRLVWLLVIGFSTPPLGANMFISSSIANVSIEKISVRALALVDTMVLIALLLAYVLQLTMWLPDMMGF